MKRILSGMRPTGPMHLGHLVGALRNWVKLQNEYECLFMAADWHAFMSEYEKPDIIRASIPLMVADWIACGINPDKSVIFIQSEVTGHLELGKVLDCITPLSWLERCPTYKEQLREMKTRNLTTYGFLGYPVLQAADILVYKSTTVPVGVDQSAHLELTREIARRFNHFYGNVFPEPITMLTDTPKLLGLDNRKMSKSYNNFIALSDEPSMIIKKVKGMITDPERIHATDPGHPSRCNVHSYYKAFRPEIAERVAEECRKASRGCAQCKSELAGYLVEDLAPLREKRTELLKDKNTIKTILERGREKAGAIASKTIVEVREKISLFISHTNK